LLNSTGSAVAEADGRGREVTFLTKAHCCDSMLKISSRSFRSATLRVVRDRVDARDILPSVPFFRGLNNEMLCLFGVFLLPRSSDDSTKLTNAKVIVRQPFNEGVEYR
jgi:hypothetical protein